MALKPGDELAVTVILYCVTFLLFIQVTNGIIAIVRHVWDWF